MLRRLCAAGRTRCPAIAPRVLRRSWHDVCTPGRLGVAAAEDVPTALRLYLRHLHERPRTVVAFSAIAAMGVGDAVAQLAWLVGVQAYAIGGRDFQMGDESKFGSLLGQSGGVAALYTPETLQGVDPEFGAWRTLRHMVLAGGLVGIAGEVWFRILLVHMPGWTYEVALRTAFDQVRRPNPPSHPKLV